MAFVRTDLHVVGGQTGNAPKICTYTTTDAMTVVRAADYFLDAIEILDVNDVILVVSASGGTPNLYWTYVNANDGSTIDVVDGLLIPTTDT